MAQSKTQIVGEVINGFPVSGVVTATAFVGDGSQLSPKKSSEKLSSHTLGDYGFGKSSK